jgi:hypothetical protein
MSSTSLAMARGFLSTPVGSALRASCASMRTTLTGRGHRDPGERLRDHPLLPSPA